MIFKYTNRFGNSYQYRGITPEGFFSCYGSPSCASAQFLSAVHEGKVKEFCVDRITDAVDAVDVVQALLDPSGLAGPHFWNGDFTSTARTPL